GPTLAAEPPLSSLLLLLPHAATLASAVTPATTTARRRALFNGLPSWSGTPKTIRPDVRTRPAPDVSRTDDESRFVRPGCQEDTEMSRREQESVISMKKLNRRRATGPNRRLEALTTCEYQVT